MKSQEKRIGRKPPVAARRVCDLGPPRGRRCALPEAAEHIIEPAIDTSDWTVADVEKNRDDVRALYVRVHDSMGATGLLPKSLSLHEDAPAMQEALA